MPTITVSHTDLNKLMGKPMPLKKLTDEAILYVKGELEKADGDELKIEIAETNRPEFWSAEGIARELRAQYGLDKGGIPKYKVLPPRIDVIVDPGLKNIRPHTVCAVVRGVKLGEHGLLQLIQLQEKLCDTFGRKRKEVAIGVYDMHKIKTPIHYKAVHPDKLSFVPLEFTSEMTLRQVLAEHPKGKEYGHLLEGHTKYPVFIDSASNVLSMPPIINSNHTGKVLPETKDLFVECSGHSLEVLNPALNVIVTALAERGGIIEAVRIRLGTKKTVTPNLKPKKILIKHEDIEAMAGMTLTQNQVLQLLKRSRYDTKATKSNYACEYPAYRQDIMHPVDVIEDVLISMGYNTIVPEAPVIASQGEVMKKHKVSRAFAEQLIGQGAQEILSYTLTNRTSIFKKMNKPEGDCVSIENATSQNWSVFRTSILPCLMEFLAANTKSEYPQHVFEIGTVVLPDKTKETRSSNDIHAAMCLASPNSDFTKARQSIETALNTLGFEIETAELKDNTFISGRSASILINKKIVGCVGEIHPKVLNEWNIQVPVCVWEINIEEVFIQK
ncbi:MAG: phenylalanine--tRNA ligase subunit beta [Candidatus Woesearchaeota archaeon]